MVRKCPHFNEPLNQGAYLNNLFSPTFAVVSPYRDPQLKATQSG